MKKIDLKKIKFSYSWVIIGISALMVCIVLGFCSSTKSLYVKAVTEAMGIPRSAFSINDSIRFIATAIINLFFGVLVAKFGPKKLISTGILLIIGSCFVYSFAESIFVYYIGGLLLGVGFSWTSTTMVGYVVNIWCKESKGTIMGAVLACNGIGGAVAAQVLSPIINSGAETYRDAYRVAGILLIAILVLVLIFFRDKPKGVEGLPAVQKKKSKGDSWEGLEFSELIKKPYFYASLVCIFLTGMVLQGIGGIATPFMYDKGIDVEYVAIVVSVHSITLTCFKFLTGFIFDKAGIRITSNMCMLAVIAAFTALLLCDNSLGGKILAMIYSAFSSLALPLETIMLPLYVGYYFGQKSFGKTLGIFVAVNTAGYAVGAPLSNLAFDLVGSYNLSLYVGLAVIAVVIVGTNIVISASNKERALMEKAKEI
ncbi:MAG: MFS transporter [Clostridia bacterium]|nr:MFS transporter [Clostridia bacterium]